MALSMDRPRDRDGNSHKFGAKSRLNSRNQSPAMKSSLKHTYRSKVIGNLKEGIVFINVTRLCIMIVRRPREMSKHLALTSSWARPVVQALLESSGRWAGNFCGQGNGLAASASGLAQHAKTKSKINLFQWWTSAACYFSQYYVSTTFQPGLELELDYFQFLVLLFN